MTDDEQDGYVRIKRSDLERLRLLLEKVEKLLD